MTLFMGMTNAYLGEFVIKEVNEEIVKTKSPSNRDLRREEILLEQEKFKRDSSLQMDLMEKPVESKRQKY